ncbi:MAG TPA: 2-hydroxychromene-2-carboxylate isomerase [Stellaceae bacterium]
MDIEFLYDFGSPNAYFAHRAIPAIEARTGAKFRYVPILLGGVFKATNNKSPVVQFAGIKNKLEYERLEIARFIKKHALTKFHWNTNFPINTLAIMRGAVAADLDNVTAPYTEAMFKGVWEDGLKLDDPAVILATLTAAGLDGNRLAAQTQEQAVKDKLIANTDAAVARGAFGAPTFFVGNEIYFGKDRLRDVEEAIIAAT